MFIFRIFILFIPLFLFCNSINLESLDLSKIKKVVQKEEEIAKEYKKFINKKGKAPTLAELMDDEFLKEGFSSKNPYGKEISIDSTEHEIDAYLLDESVVLSSNIYDYYYNNKYREFTNSPTNLQTNKVNIILSTNEKFISSNSDIISTIKPTSTQTLENKYYLDENGVLNWYGSDEKYKFSINENLIVDKSVEITVYEGTLTSQFENLLLDSRLVLYPGQKIYHEKNGVVLEYVYTNDKLVLISNDFSVDKNQIYISSNSGSAIINGDLYTWGNSINAMVPLQKNNFKKEDGSLVSHHSYPVYLTPIRNRIKNDTYFSSPLRVKFIDVFANTLNGTCAVSENYEVYCSKNGEFYEFGTNFTHVDDSTDEYLLYKSTFFNGVATSPQAIKIFAIDKLWFILTKQKDIYIWGTNNEGFASNGTLDFNNNPLDTTKIPEKIDISDGSTLVKFDDIAFSRKEGYRKILALSDSGDLYIWSADDFNSDGECEVLWDGESYNLCSAKKIETSLKFKSIKASFQSFIALSNDDKYYKINHEKDKKIEIVDLNLQNSIITDIAISSKINGSSMQSSAGIVYIDKENKLNGDYLNLINQSDVLFKNTISEMRWKKIHILNDNNDACAIDINNQMYCWGKMVSRRSGTSDKEVAQNSFLLPAFDTNVYDLTKDYMVIQGGIDTLTSISSGSWLDSDGDFYLKYPTFIGGFNYDFEFK